MRVKSHTLSLSIILFLVVLNVLTISLFWFKVYRRPGRGRPAQAPPPGAGSGEFLRRELDLDGQQVKEFKTIRAHHHQQAGTILEAIRRDRQKLYGLLFRADTDSAQVFRMAAQIGRHHAQLDSLTFYHFSRLKTVLGGDQQEKLHQILEEFFRQHRPGPPPQKNAGRPRRHPHPGDRSNRTHPPVH